MIFLANKFEQYFKIIDAKSRKLLFLSVFLGLVWFGVELSFVYILQVFLLSLKILNLSQLHIPSWFPTGIKQSTMLLIFFWVGPLCFKLF